MGQVTSDLLRDMSVTQFIAVGHIAVLDYEVDVKCAMREGKKERLKRRLEGGCFLRIIENIFEYKEAASFTNFR